MRRAWFLLLCLIPFLSSTLPATAQQRKIGGVERDRMHAILDEVAKTVEKNFHDSTLRGLNWKGLVAQAHRTIDSAETNGQMLTAIFSLLYNLQDSHTLFIPPGLVSRPVFGFEAKAFGDAIRVYELKKDSPASAAGLQLGDRIVGMNGFDADRSSFDMMTLYFRALQPVGQLQLNVIRGKGSPKLITVDAKIKQRPAVTDFMAGGGAAIWEMIREAESEENKNEYGHLQGGIGYMRLPAFYGKYDGSMRALAKKVEDDRAFIIDLRGNRGGSVEALELFAGFFETEPRVIADMMGRDKPKRIEAKPQSPQLDGPMVILVDSESSSAAEIFTRHFQRTGRAKVVGDRTSGRVTAARYFDRQQGLDRAILYGVLVATHRVVFEGGEELERKGVTPDELCIPSEDDLREKRDPCLALAGATLRKTLGLLDKADVANPKMKE
jgi:C-terminal processing protease CtpA/Prc